MQKLINGKNKAAKTPDRAYLAFSLTSVDLCNVHDYFCPGHRMKCKYVAYDTCSAKRKSMKKKY